MGPRLDELIHRARRYRNWKGDAIDYLAYLPDRGYGTLPYCDAQQNPNLVRDLIDAQTDYLNDRVYLLGARVVACAGGQPFESREHRQDSLTVPPTVPRRSGNCCTTGSARRCGRWSSWPRPTRPGNDARRST